MPTVGTTTFVEDGTHNYFTMNNRDQYLRTMNITQNWTTIKVGVMVMIEATGALPQGHGLWVGLTTSGQPGVGMKQASYNNFTAIKRMVGAGYGSGIGYLGTYGPSPWGYVSASADLSGSFVNGDAGYYMAMSGSNSTVASAGGNGIAIAIPTNQNYQFSTPRKIVMFFEVNKSSNVSYAANMIWITNYTGSTGTNHNHTMDTLTSAVGQVAGGHIIDGINASSFGAANLSVQSFDDTNFPLDTVNLYWTGSVPIRIYGLAVGVNR